MNDVGFWIATTFIFIIFFVAMFAAYRSAAGRANRLQKRLDDKKEAVVMETPKTDHSSSVTALNGNLAFGGEYRTARYRAYRVNGFDSAENYCLVIASIGDSVA